MLDWQRFTWFDWDEGNARKNSPKLDASQTEAEQIFFDDPLLHSLNEHRIHALGQTDSGRQLPITVTLRDDDTKIRVISARDMSRKERTYYEQVG